MIMAHGSLAGVVQDETILQYRFNHGSTGSLVVEITKHLGRLALDKDALYKVPVDSKIVMPRDEAALLEDLLSFLPPSSSPAAGINYARIAGETLWGLRPGTPQWRNQEQRSVSMR